MEELAMVIIVGLFGLAGLVIGLGWIAPLVLAGVARRRGWAGVWIWRAVGLVWAGMVLFLALGVGAAIFIGSRLSRGYGDSANAPAFNPADHAGQTAALRLAGAGALDCVFSDANGKMVRCVASNGVVTVPAGALTIREIRAAAADAAGIQWTASFRSWDNTPLDLAAGSVTNAGFGPPFQLAAQVEYSPVTSKISLSPICADRAGNLYRISRTPMVIPPLFRFLDAGGRVLWSGKFEAG